MKNRPLVYVLFAIAFIAIVLRICNPPQLPVPGPVGSPPYWSSSSQVGHFVAMQISPDGSQIAGLWVDTKTSTNPRSGLRILNIVDNTQIAIQLLKHFKASGLSWNGNNIMVAGNMLNGSSRYIQVNPTSQSSSTLSNFNTDLGDIISWPSDSKYLLTRKSSEHMVSFAVLDDKGTPFGKQVNIPNCSPIKWNQIDTLSRTGDCAVVTVLNDSDSTGFPNIYFCDFNNAQAKLISNKLPGRIQEVLASRQGVLIICVLRGKCTPVFYNPSDSKISELKSVPVKWSPDSFWPGSKSPLTLFVNDGVLQLDLSTLSVTRLFNYKDADSTGAPWQTQVAGALGYSTGSGDFISISVDAGEPDIRRFSKKTSENKYSMTPILSR